MTPPHILNKIRVAQTQQAKELDLSRENLAQIPLEVFELTHLEKLYLHNNKITKIPQNICRLSQLQRLDVTGNPLQHVNDAFGLILDFRQYTSLAHAIRPEQIVGIRFTYPDDVPKEIPAELLHAIANSSPPNMCPMKKIDTFSLQFIKDSRVGNSSCRKIVKLLFFCHAPEGGEENEYHKTINY